MAKTPRATRRTTTTYSPKPLPETGYVRLPSILAVVPVCSTTWWEGVKNGRFPAPIKLGPRITAWRAEDIRELLTKLNERSAG